MDLPEYTVRPRISEPEMKGLWFGPAWRDTPHLEVAVFRPEGAEHYPKTACKLCYSADMIYGIFRVDDRYIRSVHTGYQSDVWKDSCVEVFLQPIAGRGYFNFEFNCGGAMLASYIVDPTRTAGKVKGAMPLTSEECGRVSIYHSLPEIVEPEITEKKIWYLEFLIPVQLLETYAGPLGRLCGQTWKANFYKCGNETSHPHWVSWSPLEERNFHLPRNFGAIHFAG